MGFRLDPNSKQQANYKDAITAVNNNVYEFIVRPVHHYFATRIFMPLFWTQRFVIRKLHAFTRRVIEERRNNFSVIREEVQNDNFVVKKRMAMLDLLFSVKKRSGS